MMKSMYTDEQWRWLHEQYVKGYTISDIARFAICSVCNVLHHFERLGLPGKRDYLPPLDRAEFEQKGYENQ